ncbi:MAG: carboxypeptidase-like regulatory domain-containing protein, partial [Bacteroidota bacterium]
MVQAVLRGGLFLALVLLCNVLTAQSNPLDQVYRIRGGTSSVADGLARLGEAGALLTYRNDQIPQVPIQLSSQPLTLREWLEVLLAPTDLTYQVLSSGSRILLFPDPQIVTQDFTIAGTIVDALSGERLINANVFVANKARGTAANEYGYYALVLKGGSIWFRVSYVGYQEQEFNLVLKSDTTLNIRLRPHASLQPIIVTALTDSVLGAGADAGGIRIGIAETEQLSGPGGESDPLQLARLLPGITSGADGLGGIHIRGSDPGQNL